ncbi:hypothetical protein OUZ56_016341 [Daphnia magna]|uniref:Uncharacterized protein n=1 Tax=Daphnia magna TaxID=35525 RepID=A0ABR0AQD3_9CRUS|nr:hypothetical protein OUZ56_016341 [Daphnia magna]
MPNSLCKLTVVDLAVNRNLPGSSNPSQQQQPHPGRRSSRMQPSLRLTVNHRKQTLKVTDGVTAGTIANATKTLKDDKIAQEQLQENNETLKNFLEKAKSRINDLEHSLETTLATENQLQNLLKRKEAVETEGQEIVNKRKVQKTTLIQKLNTAENQIKQVSETAEQLQKEIKVLAD